MRSRRVAYRVKQFASAFAIQMRPQERVEIETLLSPGELSLYNGMSRAAQRHSLQVYRHLRRQGAQDRDLLVAALLHDVGKGQVSIVHRVAVVLLEATWPAALFRIASPKGPRWRRGFYEHCHHAELGAELARLAGSHPRVVALVRYHHGNGRQELPDLTALRQADEGN